MFYMPICSFLCAPLNGFQLSGLSCNNVGEKNVMRVVGLFTFVASPLSIKSNDIF